MLCELEWKLSISTCGMMENETPNDKSLISLQRWRFLPFQFIKCEDLISSSLFVLVLKLQCTQSHGKHWGEGIGYPLQYFWTSLVAQRVKQLPAMQESQVWFLGQEDPLKKEVATHSSTFAWKIRWMVKPGRLQSLGSQRVRHNWAASISFLQ